MPIDSLIKVYMRMFLPWIGLMIWQWSYAHLCCAFLFVFFVPVIGLISLTMLEVALMRRRALIDLYLRYEGRLYRLLNGRILILVWQVIKALVLGTALLVESINWSGQIWLMLLVDILAVGWSYDWLCRQLSTEIKPGYDFIFARRCILVLNTLLVTLLIVFVTLYTPHPDYRTLSWFEAVRYEMVLIRAECDVLAFLARLSAAKNALGWWAAETWLTELGNTWVGLISWLVFLLGSAAFAWAYTRLLLGMLVSPMRLLLSDIKVRSKAD